MNILKTILEYLPMAATEILREWKVAIISVGQEYKSTENQQDYRTRTKMTYRERGVFIDIGKTKDNFNKDRKPRCFNCNVYGYIAKDCRKLKKEQDIRKCYKCDKIRYIAKYCRSQQKMKNRSI